MPGPKPTHLHIIEGTTNVTRHRNRKLEPKPVGRLTSPPDWFGPEQLEVWTYGLRHVPPGLYKQLDLSVYVVWCCAVVAHKLAAQQVAKGGVAGLLHRVGGRPGPMLPDGTQGPPVGGSMRESPLVKTMNRQAEIILSASSVLGMSPVARTRIAVDQGQQNPNQEFFDD